MTHALKPPQALKSVDAVEILVLQDNYVDVLRFDSNEVVQRPVLVKDVKENSATIDISPIAEHGFCAFIAVRDGDDTRHLLFDFGNSNIGAAFNADLLHADLTKVEVMALSHAHMDHTGGVEELARRVGKPGIDMFVHPGVFVTDRYIKTPKGFRNYFPRVEKQRFTDAGINVVETTEPTLLLDGGALFLGQVPRTCPFETGMPNTFRTEDGQEVKDHILDDTSLVFNIKGKGLVVLSACAHSGIVNTVDHAVRTTGVSEVLAVMGGFHLTGPAFVDRIGPTIDELEKFEPTHVIPAHCTGREAILEIERRMPGRFIISMSGTTLTFAA